MNDFAAAMPSAETRRGMKVVFTIVERPEKKPLWVRVGTAWVNKDQSLNVYLDATPTNGQLHIRDYEPYDPMRARRNGDPFPGLGDPS